MNAYPIPPGITQEQFHTLVTDLYFQLTKNGLDPGPNISMGEREEILEDGTIRTHFSILVSDDAAKILQLDH